MNLLLWIVAVVLVIVGLFQLLAGAVLYGLILLVVGLVVGSFAGGYVGGRGPPL